MKTGRKPLPTHLKLVKNSTRKSRINPAEPRISAEMPLPPDFLSAEALAEWNAITPVLYRAGIVTKLDAAVLAAYCTAFGRWQIAEKLLTKEREANGGALLVVSTSRNGYRIPHPLVGIANKAMADMARYASELGITPSSRSRVEAKPPLPDGDPAAKYFT